MVVCLSSEVPHLSGDQPLPFINEERSRPAVASLGRSRKTRDKTNVLPRVKPCVLVWLANV
jgi:hypothetical protein